MTLLDPVTIPLDEGGQKVVVGEKVLESGAIRTVLLPTFDDGLGGLSLTARDCGVVAGELLRRSHPPALGLRTGETTPKEVKS